MVASDPSPWIPIVISGGALLVAAIGTGFNLLLSVRAGKKSERALEITEREHEIREAERRAQPKLELAAAPGRNHAAQLDDDGVIWTDATTVTTTVAITVRNVGDREAGRTRLRVWSPCGSSPAFWAVSPGGPEADLPRAQPDPEVSLYEPAGSPGARAERLERFIDRVLLGLTEEFFVRMTLHVAEGGETYPIEVEADAEGSDRSVRLRYVVKLRQRGY